MDIEEYAKHRHFDEDEVPPLLLRELSSRQWKTFADLGCGDGALLTALSRRGFFKDRKAYGVELSATRVDRVRSLLPDVDVRVGSAQDLSAFEDGSLDFVVSTQVIEHVPDDHKMLAEISRVLSRDGTAYVSTVHKKWYGWYFYRCNGKWVLDPTHLREYRYDAELLGPTGPAGLRIVENHKTLFKFSIADFVLRRLNAFIPVHSRFWRLIRQVRVPILGYYNWEIVFRNAEVPT